MAKKLIMNYDPERTFSIERFKSGTPAFDRQGWKYTYKGMLANGEVICQIEMDPETYQVSAYRTYEMHEKLSMQPSEQWILKTKSCSVFSSKEEAISCMKFNNMETLYEPVRIVRD